MSIQELLEEGETVLEKDAQREAEREAQKRRDAANLERVVLDAFIEEASIDNETAQTLNLRYDDRYVSLEYAGQELSIGVSYVNEQQVAFYANNGTTLRAQLVKFIARAKAMYDAARAEVLEALTSDTWTHNKLHDLLHKYRQLSLSEDAAVQAASVAYLRRTAPTDLRYSKSRCESWFVKANAIAPDALAEEMAHAEALLETHAALQAAEAEMRALLCHIDITEEDLAAFEALVRESRIADLPQVQEMRAKLRKTYAEIRAEEERLEAEIRAEEEREAEMSRLVEETQAELFKPFRFYRVFYALVERGDGETYLEERSIDMLRVADDKNAYITPEGRWMRIIHPTRVLVIEVRKIGQVPDWAWKTLKIGDTDHWRRLAITPEDAELLGVDHD